MTAFPYDLDRDQSGNWVGRLRIRLLIGMLCWLLVMIAWVGGSALLYLKYQAYVASLPSAPSTASGPARPGPTMPAQASTTTATPGEQVIINGANQTRAVVCNENDVIVNGSANQVNITGHCLNLIVSGSANHVTVDAADSITANGMNNSVKYHAGSPQVDSGGISNVVAPG